MNQSERERQEREWWNQLTILAEQDLVVDFWQTYANYLEWAGIISNYRTVIHRMVKKTVSIMSQVDKI